MRQGEVASKGQWQGSATGGVNTPEPILLPDPTRRFSLTAARLAELAKGHPMEAWLGFMADVAFAQHRAATAPIPLPSPAPALVEHSVRAQIPPLAADGHRRDPAWREGLAILLDALDGASLPEQASDAITQLRQRGDAAIEAMAGDFLHGSVEAEEAGVLLYVVAGLQVYFTRLAAGLDVSTLHLLPERGLCPCCGSTPVSGLVTATGRTPGTRYLHCSLCSTAWNHVRAICITCSSSRELSLKSIEGDNGVIVGESCGACMTYAKLLYQAKDMRADPVADDLASLGLDLLLAEAGWSRHAPNPLLLIG